MLCMIIDMSAFFIRCSLYIWHAFTETYLDVMRYPDTKSHPVIIFPLLMHKIEDLINFFIVGLPVGKCLGFGKFDVKYI